MKTEKKKIETLKVELNEGDTIEVTTPRGTILIKDNGVTSEVQAELNEPNRNRVKYMRLTMYGRFMTAHATFNGEGSELGQYEVTANENDAEFYHFEASNDCFLSYSKDKVKETENK